MKMYKGLWKLSERFSESGSAASVYLAGLIICWAVITIAAGMILCTLAGLDVTSHLADIVCAGAYAVILPGLGGGLFFLFKNQRSA